MDGCLATSPASNCHIEVIHDSIMIAWCMMILFLFFIKEWMRMDEQNWRDEDGWVRPDGWMILCVC